MINNDSGSTNNQNVTLTIAAPTVQNMRFSNNGTIWSDWETYATTKSWSLSATTGIKTVYAQFDTDGNTGTIEFSTSDTIELSTVSL